MQNGHYKQSMIRTQWTAQAYYSLSLFLSLCILQHRYRCIRKLNKSPRGQFLLLATRSQNTLWPFFYHCSNEKIVAHAYHFPNVRFLFLYMRLRNVHYLFFFYRNVCVHSSSFSSEWFKRVNKLSASIQSLIWLKEIWICVLIAFRKIEAKFKRDLKIINRNWSKRVCLVVFELQNPWWLIAPISSLSIISWYSPPHDIYNAI